MGKRSRKHRRKIIIKRKRLGIIPHSLYDEQSLEVLEQIKQPKRWKK
jgi:aconitase B